MKLTKKQYLEIRDNNSMDVMPVLCAYHNYALNGKGRKLNIKEFTVAYSEWLKIPIVALSYGNIISTVFKQMDKFYGIN